MGDLSNEDFVFVEVAKTYLMTKAQARRLVQVARILCAERQIVSLDEDGTETRTSGEDFLREDGSTDYADAATQIPDIEGLLNVEMVQATSRHLSPEQVHEIVHSWPNGWREQTMKDQGANFDDASKKGAE